VLGGLDRLENNQLSDLEVYWSLSSQILAQTRAVKAGTPIGKVHVD
jgi:hypothetical protein